MAEPIPTRKGRQRRKRTPGERLAAIMPTLVWDAQKTLGKSPIAISSSGELIETLDEFVMHCAAAMGPTARSLWRWRRAFLNGGGNLDALRDRPRSDKGVSHLFRGRARAVAIICALNAQGRAAREIYNALAERWCDLYPGSHAPSCATVRSFIQSMGSELSS